MKKGIYASIIALSLVFTANAYSAQGMYMSVDAGLAMADDVDLTIEGVPDSIFKMSFEFDTGAAFSGAVGYRMQNFRVEGEIGYQANDFDNTEIVVLGVRGLDLLGVSGDLTGEMTVLSFLANAYYDFPTGTKFTPFISAGIGWAEVEVDDLGFAAFPGDTDNADDGVLAWQVGAGVSYAITEMLDLELKYRYFMTDDLEFEDELVIDGPTSHNVYLGMRFNF